MPLRKPDMLTLPFVCASVKTTSYILKKYSKSPPSLIVHLHPTHFRFEQQDGSFPYNSEMKVIIEHIRAGTVPHDLIEELLRSGVRFYEGRIQCFNQLVEGMTC
jgi:transcription factor SPT20